MALWAIGLDEEVVLAEGAALEAGGIGATLAVGRSAREAFGAVPELIGGARRALGGEAVHEVVEFDGNVLETWHTPLRDESGQVTGAGGVAVDVTARERAYAKILEGHRRTLQMLQSHEREWQLVAYEIHDGLVQDVTGAQMHLEAAIRDLPVDECPARQELQRALDLVRRAMVEARNLIRGLRPPALDEWGIVAAIHCLVEENSAGGMSIDFIHRMPTERLEPLLEGTIYRIVQEAIANARRHSRCDRAMVRLTQTEARIHVEVRDWGIGFHPAKVGRGRFGLAGIRERARLLNGWASIESSPGRGTRILVELPAAGVPTRKALVHAKDRSAE